jgi:hypothetical protein
VLGHQRDRKPRYFGYRILDATSDGGYAAALVFPVDRLVLTVT